MGMTFDKWASWQLEDDEIYYDRMLELSRNFSKNPKRVESISKDEYISLEFIDDILPVFDPILKWLKENCTDEYLHYGELWFIFVSEIDAMAFKLRWGE